MERKLVEDDFHKTLEQLLHASKSEDADCLPGWCGPVAR